MSHFYGPKLKYQNLQGRKNWLVAVKQKMLAKEEMRRYLAPVVRRNRNVFIASSTLED